MSFRDIKYQDSAVRFLRNSIKKHSVAHAYIFTGPSGVGKKLAALNFAKALNCLFISSEKSCPGCEACKKIDAHNHPDLMLVGPEKERGSIKLETVRDLLKSISVKPYEGKKKVFIIDQAESMTDEAQNALLKTLEEPPKDSVMILLSENMGCLLPTIISRAQMVRFFPLRAVEAKNMLMRDYKLDPAKAHILSYISSGSIGEAIRLMDSGFFDKRARIVKSMIAKTSVDSELESSPKSDLDVYLNIALTYYRDMMVVKSGSSSAALINIDKKEDIINAAKRMKFDEIDEVIKQIILTGSYLDQNVNPKLAIASIGLSLAAK